MSVGHNIPREKQWEWQHLQIDQWGWSVYKSRSLKEIIALGKYYFHIRTIETSQFYIVNTVLFRFLQESVFSKQNVFVVNNRKVLMLLVGFFFFTHGKKQSCPIKCIQLKYLGTCSVQDIIIYSCSLFPSFHLFGYFESLVWWNVFTIFLTNLGKVSS